MRDCVLCGRQTPLTICRKCRDHNPDIQRAIQETRLDDELARAEKEFAETYVRKMLRTYPLRTLP